MKDNRGPEYGPRKAAADPQIDEIERNEHAEDQQRSKRRSGCAFGPSAGPAAQHQSNEGESGEPADDLPGLGELDSQEQPNEQGRETYQNEPRPRFDCGCDRYRYRFVPLHISLSPAASTR